MARKIQEVASFDIETDKAVKSINSYITSLKKLEAERAKNIKLGKDTVAVNKKIDQSIDQINASLKQQSSTRKGQVAQLETTRRIQKQITADSQKRLNVQKREIAQRKSLGSSIRANRRQFSDLRFVAAGAATAIIAGFAVAAEGLAKFNELLFPSIALTNKLAESTKSAAKEYVQEKAELDNLFTTAQADNENKEQRLAAVDMILEQYGPYLSDLEKEQVRLGNVSAAQIIATDLLLKNIVAKQKAAVAEQLLGEIIDGTIEKQRRQAEATQGITGAANTFVGAVNTGLANAFRFSTGQFGNLGTSASNATDLLNKFSDVGIQSAIDQLKLLGKVSDTEAANFLKQFDVLVTDVEVPDIVPDPDKTKTGTAKTAKAVKDLTGTIAGLRKQLSEAQSFLKEGIQIADEEGLTKQQNKILDLQKQVKELDEFLKTIGQDAIELTDLDLFVPDLDLDISLDNKTVEESLQKGLDQLSISDLKAKIEGLEIEGLIDVEAIEDARNAALNIFRGTADERDALNERFNQQRLARERTTTRQILELQLQILRAERAIAQQAGESITEFDKKIAELNLQLTELGAKDVDVKLNVDTGDAETKIGKFKETLGFVVDGVEQLGGQIIQFFQQQTDQVLNKLEGDVARQEAFLDSLLNNQEGANAQQVQAERDRLDALVAERQKAVEKQQALAQLEVALNAAIAIARAAAEGGAGAAITIAATLISLAIGFAQARATASQAFAGGSDYVTRGKGEPSGTDTINAKLDEGEAVIQADKNKRYHTAVKAIRRGSVDPELLNDFVTNPEKYKQLAAASASGLMTPSLQRRMSASGITLNAVGGGLGKKDVDQLIGEMRQMKDMMGSRAHNSQRWSALSRIKREETTKDSNNGRIY
jgi:hypothetical protein